MDIREYNRVAWDREVERGNRCTVPVSEAVIAAARQGQWEILLTSSKPVPRAWFPDLEGLDVLGLASGGGQQGPVLAAAGAKVTVPDNSPKQLEQDRSVAERYALPYSDLTSLTAEERQRYIQTGAPLEFSHTLEDQIGGQLDAGFLLTAFLEDAYPEDENDLLTDYMPTFIATRATKPYHKTREEDLV
jgi:hypothetical protein